MIYRFTIASGRIIHDIASVSADSESDARALLQERINLGEFDQSSVDVSADPSMPLEINFPVQTRPRILFRVMPKKKAR